MDYQFTKMQCLKAIANWKHEPFQLNELNFLIGYFTGLPDDTILYYGEDDIEEVIAQTLHNYFIQDPKRYVKDIAEFAVNHKFTGAQIESLEVFYDQCGDDIYKIQIHTVDGPYEEVHITVNLIA